MSRVSSVCVCVCGSSRLAHLSEVPEDVTIQKQKLINQPVPELSLSFLSLVSSLLLSSLHPCIPPSLLLQRSGEQAEAAVTQLHQDSLCPSVRAALLHALSSPTHFHCLLKNLYVFSATLPLTFTNHLIKFHQSLMSVSKQYKKIFVRPNRRSSDWGFMVTDIQPTSTKGTPRLTFFSHLHRYAHTQYNCVCVCMCQTVC